VWNKQRKDEVLIDVDDVALGHTTKLRWNDTDKWLWSEKIVQPPIIDRETFDQVQAMVAGRAAKHAEHRPHRQKHPYALRGLVICGLCERRMQSDWVNGAPYYRCRFPAEYALANRVQHPPNVNLREDAVIGRVDKWLAREFAPHRMSETLRALAEARQPDNQPASDDEKTAVDRRLRPQASPVPRRAGRWGEPGHGRRVDRRDRSREGFIRTGIAQTRSAPPHDTTRDQVHRGQVRGHRPSPS
jgi:hypothetical protein